MEDFRVEVYDWNKLAAIIDYTNGKLKIDFFRYKNLFNFDENSSVEDILYFFKSRVATGIKVNDESIIDYLMETEGKLMIDKTSLKFIKAENKKSDKINNPKQIEDKTGLGLGNLIYSKAEISITPDEFYQDDDYIYDTKTCRFHFLPVITAENMEIWEEYLEKCKEVRKSLIEKLNDEYNFNLKVSGTGSVGCIKPLSHYPGTFNNFFRCITVGSEESGFYSINFIRWFIDDGKVNCKMGEFQFDASDNGYENKNNIVNYPLFSRDMVLDEINFNSETNSCIYNPSGAGDIWNLDMNRVIKSFSEFINYIAPQLKNN